MQRLQERVRELEGERDRLVQERDNATAGLSRGGRADSAGTTDRIIYLPRERKCPVFRGTRGIGIDEWIEEVRASMRVRHVGRADEAGFIFDHLEGEARDEIKYRTSAERDDPETVFKILKELYGCQKPYILLQEDFFSRRQLEGETLQEFSHALFCLMERVVANAPYRMTNSPTLLRDQFVENVNNPNLRRELKRLVRENPTSTLLDVRSEAIKWEREGGVVEGRANFHSVPTLCATQNVNVPQQVPPTSDTATQLASLAALVQTQQEQLAQITQTLAAMQLPTPRSPGSNAVICHRCQQTGHIARYCNVRARFRPTSARSSPVVVPTSPQETEN